MCIRLLNCYLSTCSVICGNTVRLSGCDWTENLTVSIKYHAAIVVIRGIYAGYAGQKIQISLLEIVAKLAEWVPLGLLV